jgi:hypothetical protein
MPTVEQALRKKFVQHLDQIFLSIPNYYPMSTDLNSFYARFDYQMMNKLLMALEDNNENKEQKRLELVEKLRMEVDEHFSTDNVPAS